MRIRQELGRWCAELCKPCPGGREEEMGQDTILTELTAELEAGGTNSSGTVNKPDLPS